MDKENGNVVKADRFGYVKRAMHGTKMLSNRAIRCVLSCAQMYSSILQLLKKDELMLSSKLYGRELVDLRNESRWEFLNTLFSVSEAVMYMQVLQFSGNIVSIEFVHSSSSTKLLNLIVIDFI